MCEVVLKTAEALHKFTFIIFKNIEIPKYTK